MTWARRFWLKLQALFHRNRSKQRLNDEMQFHLDQQVAENLALGMGLEEARYAAMRAFGNPALLKEETRGTWGWNRLEQMAQDVRFGLRMLRKSPGFATVAVFTLALGIGANTAIFSLIDVVLLRPLPVRDPDRVVVLEWRAHKQPHTNGYGDFGVCHMNQERSEAAGCSFSYPFLEQVRSQTEAFSSVTAFAGSPNLHLERNGQRARVNSPLVSGEFFETLGVRVALGRTLQPSDDVPSAPPVTVLNYGYWQTEFGGDPSILGKTLSIDHIPVTVVGVAEPNFEDLIPGSTWDMSMPLSLYPRLNLHWAEGLQDGASWWLTIVGRVKSGVSLAQAQAAVSLSFRNQMLHGATPFSKEEDDPRISLLPAQQGIVGDRWSYRKPFYLLMAAVGFILLIACSNVSGLMLARMASRQKEIAVRLALGGGHARIIRQLLTESLLLSALGGSIGVFLAYWSLEALRSSNWLGSIHYFSARPDTRLLLFSGLVSILAGILPGLAPAFRGTRMDLTSALKENARTFPNISQHGRRLNLGSALVVAQVTLSMLVLAGAGLLVRTLANLKSINPGFDTRNLLLIGLDLKDNEYSGQQAQNLYRELESRFTSLPGVTNVSYSSDALLSGSLWTTSVHIEGKEQTVSTDTMSVGPHFFDTMRIPLLAGRAFTQADFGTEPKVVFVNQAFVRRYLNDRNPIGLHLSASKKDPGKEIIGVVGDAKYNDLKREIEPTEYIPLNSGHASFELRSAVAPESVIPVVRGIIKQLDSHLPAPDFKTQREQIDRSLFRERLVAHLSSIFGLLALGLACLGLYGLLSYEVTRRTREIGIRTAMGAQQRDVLRLVVGQGIALATVATVGAAAGIAGALGLTRYLQSLLYGVRPTDPATFVSVAFLLTLVSLAACYIPARRATRVDPMVALRYE